MCWHLLGAGNPVIETISVAPALKGFISCWEGPISNSDGVPVLPDSSHPQSLGPIGLYLKMKDGKSLPPVSAQMWEGGRLSSILLA